MAGVALTGHPRSLAALRSSDSNRPCGQINRQLEACMNQVVTRRWAYASRPGGNPTRGLNRSSAIKIILGNR